ncbi:alpha/beta fold hydrolase [Streptomyces sp. NPDC048362]|uniref:alpha/beta fold hydrolase n=1 Tax=Streptomyces sp. NPDC048362 TaxID=3365539 RepID=UPI003710B2EE
MPTSAIRLVRFAGRLLLLAMAAATALVVVFLALIALTDGAGSGLAAWLTTLGVGAVLAMWRGRRRTWTARLAPFLPVAVAAALTASVCIPTVPTARRYPPALPFVATQHWSLTTGSRVAVYHYPPTHHSPRHPVPLVYLNGGPVRGISVLDHRFLQLLARQGYDVYAYEQAGGGRSNLLPMGQYTISRTVSDLAAFIDRLNKGKVDILGFSSGGAVLTRSLADPSVTARLHRAIIAEPGPMDGPTAHIAGHPSRRAGVPVAGADGAGLRPRGVRRHRCSLP